MSDLSALTDREIDAIVAVEIYHWHLSPSGKTWQKPDGTYGDKVRNFRPSSDPLYSDFLKARMREPGWFFQSADLWDEAITGEKIRATLASWTKGNSHIESNPQPGDPCHTLHSGDAPAVVLPIGFWGNQAGSDAVTDGFPTLRANTLGGGNCPAVALVIRGRDGVPKIEMGDDVANAILTPNGGRGGIGVGAVMNGMAVRRLTPRECERLQGFPDDFTALDNAADGPRYKALGNSMAVPVICWIGRRITATGPAARAEPRS